MTNPEQSRSVPRLRPWRALRHALEYGLAVPLLALMRAVPPRTACRLAESLADLAFWLLPHRRHLAERNILAAGVATSAHDARRIAHASFRHLAAVIAESFHAPIVITAETWQDRVVLETTPETRALLQAPGRGVLLVSGHLGNWEVASLVLALQKPLTAIARPMNNPLMQALLDRHNLRGSIEVVPKRAANPHRLVNALRQGRILAILSDQHAPDSRVWIDFFGRPAATYTTPALLHLLTGAPILFGCPARTGVLKYHIRLSEPMVFPRSGDRSADVLRITEALTRRLEEGIRQHPEQYLWSHRRWRTPPPDVTAGGHAS